MNEFKMLRWLRKKTSKKKFCTSNNSTTWTHLLCLLVSELPLCKGRDSISEAQITLLKHY